MSRHDNPGVLHELLLKAMGELGEKNVNVVVNNAGLANAYMPSPEENPSENEILHRLELFDNYISNNLRSAFLVTEVCKPLFPDPINAGGRKLQCLIILLASLTSRAQELYNQNLAHPVLRRDMLRPNLA